MLLALSHAQTQPQPEQGAAAHQVSLQVMLDGNHAASNSARVVVWLEPSVPRPAAPGSYVLTQKNKQFLPHLLIVPVGSSVDFPNQDPFFHNVFSLFNGRRFDLGLYESHTHRAVRFDGEGGSYIFCNIDPEMGAVIIALATPYFAISSTDGRVTLTGLPAGAYRSDCGLRMCRSSNLTQPPARWSSLTPI
jgi:plastocyanin